MHILVTAGPTREYIDPVRFISNSSTGQMGYAVAQAAKKRGHQVTLITGPVELEPPKGVRVIKVTSADEMYRAALKIYPKVDVVVMAAAVGDYKPKIKSRYKIKKDREATAIALELVPNPDIIAQLGRRKKDHQLLVGFALEDRAGHDHALEKFSKKNLDIIVLNSPTALGSSTNNVQVYTREYEWQKWPETTKTSLGQKLVKFVESLLAMQK
jgi:phosphopantothenoylcysteine decarboxylase/phosphopantothenate--cysteine ligase